MNSVDDTLASLSEPFAKGLSPRLVQRMDGTTAENPNLSSPEDRPFTRDEEAQVDGMFGASVAYAKVKKERPLHRLILWAALNGQKPKEIALSLRVTPQTVYNIQGQPWFQEAFCKITAERGQDALQTILEGELVPTVKKLIEIRDAADTPAAVKRQTCVDLLDRLRGKPTVHVKNESSGTLDVVVHDADALRREYERNQEILSSRGIRSGTN